MGTDAAEVLGSTIHTPEVKVHLSMCKLLLELVDRILKIIPDIEASRPCSQGTKALCDLHNAFNEAKVVVQNCRTSSKLFLAMTRVNVKRFEKTKALMDQSLSVLQNMVPIALGMQISEILDDLRALKFLMDSCEELAGKSLRALLQQDEPQAGNLEIDLFLYAASQLDLKSKKDLLIEAKCLKKLLNDVKPGSITKTAQYSNYLFNLLKKHRKLILLDQSRTSSIQLDQALISVESNSDQHSHSGHEISDQSIVTPMYGSLDNTNSILNTASSMNDIDIQIDMSNLSLGSIDSSYNTLVAKLENSFGSNKSYENECPRFQVYGSIDEIRTQFLSNIGGFSWEFQCAAIRDVHTYLISHNPSWDFVTSENFLDPLVSFLFDALNKHDTEAQQDGSRLFLVFLRSDRWELDISEDVYTFLASVLATEPAAETLAIMEVLSSRVPLSKFAASGALHASILKILESHRRDLQESAVRVLQNFSSSIDSSSCNLASDWIPVLVHLLGDSSVAGICLGILETLCKFGEIRRSIGETQGFIPSIAKLLKDCDRKEHEYAVSILLALCSQHDYYCELVMNEGCKPLIVNISNIGSEKGKAIAVELLRQLDFNHHEEQEHPRSNIEQECARSNVELERPRSNVDVSKARNENSNRKSINTSGFFSNFKKKRFCFKWV